VNPTAIAGFKATAGAIAFAAFFALSTHAAIAQAPAAQAPAVDAQTVAHPPQDPYAPLANYDGTWSVTPNQSSGARPAAPDTIQQHCAHTGKFFVCEQTVNKKTAGLMTFIPTVLPGIYITQTLLPTGQALGLGELLIDGDRWVYSSRETANGKTLYHRTTNTFSNANRTIQFQVEESNDGESWTTTLGGTETKVK
jgi:invasion protein IalB